MKDSSEKTTISIRQRSEIDPLQWDKFVDSSPQAWLWHSWDSQDAIDTWPGKSDLSFAFVDEEQTGEIIAIMPLHKVDQRIANVVRNCILESTGGLAYLPNLSKRQIEIVNKKSMDYILNLANKESAESIDITLTPMAPKYRGINCPRVNPLIDLGFQNISTQTYILELNGSIEPIWKNMEGYCRTHIRKAERSGVIIREANDKKDLEIYYNLHCETYNRTGVKPHPKAYFQKIWDSFVSQGKAKVFFAELDGKVIAADNEAVYKKAISGWTAAGINNIVPGVNNLLHWHAIKWAIENSFEFYECGEGFPGEKRGKRKGLTDFKKSFGGILFPFFRGQYINKNFLVQLRKTYHAIKG
jgi:hypothetical protein